MLSSQDEFEHQYRIDFYLNHVMKNNIYPLVAVASFAFAAMTNAEPITWGQPQTIADALSDVETDGDLVFAIDAGGKGGTAILRI